MVVVRFKQTFLCMMMIAKESNCFRACVNPLSVATGAIEARAILRPHA